MVEESGLVVDTGPGYAWVQSERRSACSGCAARSGCGSGILSGILGRRPTRLRALNAIGAETGEHVIVGIQESVLVTGSVAVYITPLLAMIAGAGVGTVAAPGHDLLAVIGGAGGFAAALFWLGHFGNRIRRDSRYQPVVLRRLPAVSAVNHPIEALNPPGRM